MCLGVPTLLGVPAPEFLGGVYRGGVVRLGVTCSPFAIPLCWDVSALEADEPFDRELRRRVGVWAGVEPPWVGAGDLALVVLEGPALFSEAPGDLTASRDLSDLAEALERVEALERPERLDLVEDALDLVDRLDLAEALDLAEVADLAECSETSLPQGESDLIPRSSVSAESGSGEREERVGCDLREGGREGGREGAEERLLDGVEPREHGREESREDPPLPCCCCCWA